MTKEERKAYMKTYYKTNKEKYKTSNKAYRESHKEEKAVYMKDYRQKLNNSEGIGVYKATYSSGIYIGSGLLYKRRVDHLYGDTGIARTLNEKAISFEVLSLTGTKEESLELEQLVIDTLGLDNLLNEQNAMRELNNGINK